MEFAENLVLKVMEDPKERDRKFREHLYAMKDKCKKTKEISAKFLGEGIHMVTFFLKPLTAPPPSNGKIGLGGPRIL